MKIIQSTFIDIHYALNERTEAEKLAQSFEKICYTRESDGEDCIQLLISAELHEEAPIAKD